MKLPSGLLDLLSISGLFSQVNTREAAATIRDTSVETLNAIDKNHQHLGTILAFYLDEKALQADWFQQQYWTKPLSRQLYPQVTAVSRLFDEDRFNHLDELERLLLRFCILQGFKGPFKDPKNPRHYRDDAAKTQLLEKYRQLIK